MRIHVLSDLHIDHTPYTPKDVACDAVILAGDIHSGTRGLIWAREQWPHKEIFYVAGNHEFYGLDRLQTLSSLRLEAINQGIHFLDNDEVIIDDIRFLGATLWTDFALFGEDKVNHCLEISRFGLNDFRVIHEDYERFTPQSSLELHQASVEWLANKLSKPFDSKTVVITHHAPSYDSIEAKYQDDYLSSCFASRLDALVEKTDIWIHGHTHASFDYRVGNGRVICNPRGYMIMNELENNHFDASYVLEL